jgi:hypothetical protein
MIHTATRTMTYVKLSDLANAYADKFHDRGTESHDDVTDEFMEAVSNSKFTWGDNDAATFVRFDRFCDVIRVVQHHWLEEVELSSADIYVLLEE